jgi:ribosome-binding protein aMBF1 (putative translation factor)
MSDSTICDLCGLKIGAQVWKLKVAGNEIRFCCEGCKGIYQMLNNIDDSADDTSSVTNPEQGEKS